MNSRKRGVVFLSWFFVALWMLFIYLLSAQVGEQSSELSGGFVEFVGVFVRVFSPNASDETIHVLVRKFAHMTEYAILAILLINALRQHISKKQLIYFISFGVASLYAVTDEIHQVFVPGRTGSLMDVLIDSIGVILGITFFELFVQVFKRGNETL